MMRNFLTGSIDFFVFFSVYDAKLPYFRVGAPEALCEEFSLSGQKDFRNNLVFQVNATRSKALIGEVTAPLAQAKEKTSGRKM